DFGYQRVTLRRSRSRSFQCSKPGGRTHPFAAGWRCPKPPNRWNLSAYPLAAPVSTIGRLCPATRDRDTGKTLQGHGPMADRVFNFSPGPAVLPLKVLEEAQRDLLALPGLGISAVEISHRS